MTQDDPTCLCIEDIVAALNMAADDEINWWPPETLESLAVVLISDKSYVMVNLKGHDPKLLSMARVKKAAEHVGIDIWECYP